MVNGMDTTEEDRGRLLVVETYNHRKMGDIYMSFFFIAIYIAKI